MTRQRPHGWSLSLSTITAGLIAVAVARALATVPPPDWELSLFHGINGGADLATPLWWPVMQFGSLGGAALLSIALGVGWRPQIGGRIAIATGSAWAVAQVLKTTIGRARPASLGVDIVARAAETSTGTGFPSGHAAVAFAAAVVLVLYLSGWWRVIPIAVAVSVALARVYVGVHLPLDVVGGAAVGVVVGLIMDIALPGHPIRPWWVERRRTASVG